MENFGVIIAARTGSRRLPAKALLPLNGIPMIAFIIRRLLRAKLVKSFILATTTSKTDDALEAIAKSEGIEVYRGEAENVVKRYKTLIARLSGSEKKFIKKELALPFAELRKKEIMEIFEKEGKRRRLAAVKYCLKSLRHGGRLKSNMKFMARLILPEKLYGWLRSGYRSFLNVD